MSERRQGALDRRVTGRPRSLSTDLVVLLNLWRALGIEPVVMQEALLVGCSVNVSLSTIYRAFGRRASDPPPASFRCECGAISTTGRCAWCGRTINLYFAPAALPTFAKDQRAS